jgi:hypothetical protein
MEHIHVPRAPAVWCRLLGELMCLKMSAEPLH